MNKKKGRNTYIKHFVFLFLLLFVVFSLNANTYRVLVAVTPAAIQQMGVHWRDAITQKVVTTPNIIYHKSPTSDTAQIAGIVIANYTETNESTGVCNLHNVDGIMDTVFTLRNNYAADIVTLYGNYPSESGLSWAVGADQSSAFYVVDQGRADGQYSTSHEMGHLFGAAHDTAHSLVPLLPYGYGMWTTSGGQDYGTIMSYYGVANRQMFYSTSNKDSLFPVNGHIRGTAQKCDVTRLHGDRGPTVDAFRNPLPNVVIANRIFKGQEYGDVMSSDSITVNGPDSLKDTTELRLRANQKVVINSGFCVGQNASFTIRTGTGALLGKKRTSEQFSPPGFKSSESSNNILLKTDLQAILNNGIIRVRYTIPEEAPVSIQLFNMAGRLVFKKSLGNHIAGQFDENVNLEQLKNTKIYLLKMSAGKTIMTAKVIGIR